MHSHMQCEIDHAWIINASGIKQFDISVRTGSMDLGKIRWIKWTMVGRVFITLISYKLTIF